MKKKTFTLAMVSMAVMANAGNYDQQTTNRSKVEKNGSQYVESHNKNGEMVYYCKGSKAYSFHLYSDCSGLNQCTREIVSIPQKAAQDSGRARCKNCWNRLQKEKAGK